jgi:CheY-like chemotaxis protein
MSPWTHPATSTLASIKTRRALLVDQSSETRELRAEMMRKVGIEVDCAADITEARSMWRPDLYSLVLMNVEDKLGDRERFCERLRTAKPVQQVAFLVGKPEYLSGQPGENGESMSVPAAVDAPAFGAANAEEPLATPPTQQRWGILEASRRISEVRSAHLARTRAIRDRAERVAATRTAQPTIKSLTLDELVRKEMR